MVEPPTISEPFPYAGFGQRVSAYFVDGAIMTAVGLVFALVFGFAVGLAIGFSDLTKGDTAPKVARSTGTEIELITEALVVLLAWTYFAYFWKTRGATPGQRLMHIRVVDSTTYQGISTRQSVVRYLGYIVSALPLYLGFIWASFDSHKQGWHDKIAGTVVIRTS
jgi:uncharacterized RDD family membrane protein YckC